MLSKTGCEFAKPVADRTCQDSGDFDATPGQGNKADAADARLNETVKESSECNLYVKKIIIEYRLK